MSATADTTTPAVVVGNPAAHLSPELRAGLFEYLLGLGDDALILGHRLSEWCGHAPILEEDIALANIALDCLGQATAWLRLAGLVEGKGRSEDTLAYFREAREFRNCHLVEQPRGDFGFTITRLFLHSVFAHLNLKALEQSSLAEVAAIAAKSGKEVRYHVRHSSEWMRRLGDGTEESHRRVATSVDELWSFVDELFTADTRIAPLTVAGIVTNPSALRPEWNRLVSEVLASATLTAPEKTTYSAKGGRSGFHSEHLGLLLAEMQILARSHPGATW